MRLNIKINFLILGYIQKRFVFVIYRLGGFCLGRYSYVGGNFRFLKRFKFLCLEGQFF